MELNDFKDLYQKETVENVPEVSLEKQKEIHLPLEKIRANMRLEFWSTIISLLAIFVFMVLMPGSFRFKFYVIVLVSSMVVVTLFFYSKFFKLYKEIVNLNVKTMDSLKDLLYQFALNKQYYFSFYISFAPFLVSEMIIINEFYPSGNHTDFKMAAMFIFVLVFTMLLLFWFGKIWFHYFYGRYINKVEDIYKSLK